MFSEGKEGTEGPNARKEKMSREEAEVPLGNPLFFEFFISSWSKFGYKLENIVLNDLSILFPTL